MSTDLRAQLRRVLGDWKAGRMTCQGVQHWAAGASTQGADEYITMVVRHLRGLGEYLITVDDIPFYLRGLEKSAAEGVDYLKRAGAAFDTKARATELKNDPFYGPHTRAILRELK